MSDRPDWKYALVSKLDGDGIVIAIIFACMFGALALVMIFGK